MHERGCELGDARKLFNALVPPGKVSTTSPGSSLEDATRRQLENLTPAERAIVERRFNGSSVGAAPLGFVAAQGEVAKDPKALEAAAGASVVAHPDALVVNGVALNMLDAYALLRAKDNGDVRFIVMPVPENGIVLLTFGHAKSPDQYCFRMAPDFAEQFGQLLIRSARQLRGIHSPPTAT